MAGNKLYIFEGDRIKLTTRDYHKMRALYPHLDLTRELEQLDMELRNETDKRWFMTLNAKLNYRNKKAAKEVRHTRDNDLTHDLMNREWIDQPGFFDNITKQ